MLDTLRDVETPEGVALQLRCAGVVPRALAWLLDLLVRWPASPRSAPCSACWAAPASASAWC
jgi:hypothetical protein